MPRRVLVAGALVAALALSEAAGAAGPDRDGFDQGPLPTDRLDHDLWALALNIYHEAGGEGRRGMLAVGWLTLNRLRHPGFPETLVEVVFDANGNGCAFSWTCDAADDRPRDPIRFARALAVARELLSAAPPPDPTRGALFMHARSRKPPAYTRTLRRSAVIGQNVFYRPS
jgi:spore germination cell wall hydrolase CwlJ-like protein